MLPKNIKICLKVFLFVILGNNIPTNLMAGNTNSQIGVNDIWNEYMGGRCYALNNNGHANDRHALMNAEACRLRARQSGTEITSFGNAANMNAAVAEAWQDIVNSNRARRHNGRQVEVGQIDNYFFASWSNQTNHQIRIFNSVRIVFQWNTSTHQYDLITAYPCGIVYHDEL